MEFKHKSVLLDETIDSLNIKPDGIYVDGTLGGGGHSLEICKRLSDKGRLIGIDQDLDAIAAATERLKDYKDRVTIVHSNYQDIDAVLKNCSVSGVDESFWISVSPRISLIMWNVGLLIVRIRRLICG